MIEIEKKFMIENETIKNLLADAQYIKTDIINDKYYDDSHYSLTSRDWWLRLRDRIFELKVPLPIVKNDGVDRYDELSDSQLKDKLNLAEDLSLDKAILFAGYSPFAKIITSRRIYKIDKFTIAIDSMDYGYETGEIELLVNNKNEAEEGSLKILEFAKEYNLGIKRFRGKVFEYLWRYNKRHYDVLLRAGVVKL